MVFICYGMVIICVGMVVFPVHLKFWVMVQVHLLPPMNVVYLLLLGC